MKVALILVICIGTPAVYALTLADIEAAQVSAWKNRRSVRMEIEYYRDMSLQGALPKQFEINTIKKDLLRQGGIWLSKSEIATVSTASNGEKTELTTLIVDDGTVAISIENHGERVMKLDSTAYRTEVPRPNAIWPQTLDVEIEVLPNETISGVECYAYILRGKGKYKSKLKHCVGVKDGVEYLREFSGNKGTVDFRWTVKSVEFDVDMNPARFKVEIGPGIEIIDKTKK